MIIDIECDSPTNEVKKATVELLRAGGQWCHANRGLQDQFVFASGWGTEGVPLGQVISETRALARSEAVERKWFYDNAARIFA